MIPTGGCAAALLASGFFLQTELLPGLFSLVTV